MVRVLFGFSIFINCICLAQITPPGLGKVNTASWFAVGLKQDLNIEKTLHSSTYFGLGRLSRPTKYNPFQREGIYVLNEKISHQFKKHWKYSVALSYRWQKKYKLQKLFDLDMLRARQEARIYGQFSYLNQFKKIAFQFTIRPEIRFFHIPNFDATINNTSFRSRFYGKVAYDLDKTKTQQLIAKIEFLLSTTKKEKWKPWRYNDTRLSFYYSISMLKNKVNLNIGYMNDLIGLPATHSTSYFALDVTFKNLF